MKEFLDKLYSYEYFGEILFIVIGVLVLAFIIILILGLRDAKKNKNAKEIVEESDLQTKNATDTFNEVASAPVDLSVNNVNTESVVLDQDNTIEIKQPINNTFSDVKVNEPTTFEELPVVENNTVVEPSVVETPVVAPTPIVEPKVEEVAPVAPINSEVEKVAATPNNLEQANNDLDAIAAALLAEYNKNQSEDTMLKPSNNTIPMPNNDVELPTKVVDKQDVIDTTRDVQYSVNDIASEEYNINK